MVRTLPPFVRGQRGRAHLPEVMDLDSARGARVIPVDLPSITGPAPRSQTVQDSPYSTLAPETAKTMHRLRSAVVPDAHLATSSGAVIDSAGRLVLETLWDRDHWRRAFDPAPDLPEATYVPGRHASLISVWCHNYHHWLFEALPRLAVLRASGIEFDKLIVPDPMTAFQRDSLGMLGIDENARLPFHGEHLVVDELVWATPLAPFEQPTRFLIDWLRESLGDTSPIGPDDGGPVRRLYLRREGGRRVANEDELLSALAPLRFESVNPDALPFRDQVALFERAAVLVGSHGAAFSNGIFSPRLVALELYHSGLINGSTLGALAGAGHEHWSLVCKRVHALRRPRHQDLIAPVELVIESLARMGVRP